MSLSTICKQSGPQWPHMDKLAHRVKCALDWSRVLAKKGNTQVSERYYVDVIKDQIVALGGRIGSSAGSQQSVDIRDVAWPDGTNVSIECKKVNKKGSNFMFNDTFLKSDVWYMFLWVDQENVSLLKGSSIIEKNIQASPTSTQQQLKVIAKLVIDMSDGDTSPQNFKSLFRETLELMKIGVLEGVLTFFDYGELFKSTTRFGNIISRPRPNWSISVPCEATDTPPESGAAEPHSPAEQSDV